jgi:hypothetical protein
MPAAVSVALVGHDRGEGGEPVDLSARGDDGAGPRTGWVACSAAARPS